MRRFRRVFLAAVAAVLFARTSCEANSPPDAPVIVDGPASGTADSSYAFQVTGSDPDGDSIAFRLDWGDGVTSGWSPWAASGATTAVRHAWVDSGTYAVRAQVRDRHAASDWSGEHIVAMVPNTPEFPWRVVSTISVGLGAGAVAVQPGGEYVYVLPFDKSANDGRVAVLRVSDNALVDSVDVGMYPLDLVFVPGGEYCYVSHDPFGKQGVWLMAIRTQVRAVVDTIEVARWPAGMAALPDGERLYVPCRLADSLLVVRVSDNVVADSLRLDGGVLRALAAPDGDMVYVSGGSAVYVVRTADNSVVDSVPLEQPDGLAVTVDGAYLYVSCPRGGAQPGRVYVIRTSDNAVVDSVEVGLSPGAMAMLPGSEYVYVVNELSRSVSVIRTADRTRVATIDVGQEPNDVDALPDGRSVYVTCWAAPVQVIGY